VARNRRQQARRDQARKAFLAKPNPLGSLHRAKLAQIRSLGHLAKPIAFPEQQARQIDGILDYLEWRWRLAKPNHIDRPPDAVPE
jgi:hypothetical protein